MCVYNGRRVTLNEFLRLKQMEKALKALEEQIPLVQYGYDYRSWPILKPTEKKDDFKIVMAHWEFLPDVLISGEEHLQFRSSYDTLNARGENLLTSPLYAEAARHGRCLVPSWGYYEFRHLTQTGQNGQPLKVSAKYPYRVYLPGQDYFFMAGVCRQTYDIESGEVGDTFSIITTEANNLASQVHKIKKRMPVILPEEEAYEWLFTESLSDERIKDLATFRISSNKMKAYTVRRDFRTSEDPTEPCYYPEVPKLVI